MTDTSDLVLIDQGAIELRLPGIRAHYVEYLEAARRENWSHGKRRDKPAWRKE